jgi:tetratricopeptide (TPR) repeat protein
MKLFRKKTDSYYYEEACNYHELRKWEEAIINYTEFIRCVSDFSSVFINRGSCFIATQQYERAISDFSEFIRLEPTNPLGYVKRAFAYQALSNHGFNCYDQELLKRALVDLSVAIRLNPNAAYQGDRACVHFLLGNCEEAIIDCNTAIQLAPHIEGYHDNLNRFLEHKKNKERIEALDRINFDSIDVSEVTDFDSYKKLIEKHIE